MKTIIIFLTILLVFISCKDSTVKQVNNSNTEIKLKQHDTITAEISEEKVILISDSIVSPEAENPFLKLKFDKVICYDYDGSDFDSENQLIIDSKEKLHPKVSKQKVLSQNQIKEFINYIGNSSTYGNTKAFCFEPHLGIVFYENNKVVTHLSICLDCNYLISSIDIPATGFKKFKIGDEHEYDAEGFSKLGRQKINDLCKSLEFSHCEEKLDSMFD